MAEEEKIVTINLKKDLVKIPRWKRSKLMPRILKRKLKKIVKTDVMKIDKRVNEKIWSKGIEKPVVKLRVKVTKIDDKSSKVELI